MDVCVPHRIYRTQKVNAGLRPRFTVRDAQTPKQLAYFGRCSGKCEDDTQLK